MTMGFDAQGGKKDSIFSSLSPARPDPVLPQRSAADADKAAQLRHSIEALEKKVATDLEKRIASLEKDNEELRALLSKPPPPGMTGLPGGARIEPGVINSIREALVNELNVKVAEFSGMTSGLVKFLRDGLMELALKFESRLEKAETELRGMRENAKSVTETVTLVESAFKSMSVAVRSAADENVSQARSLKALEERFSQLESAVGRYSNLEAVNTKISLLESRCDLVSSANEKTEGKLRDIVSGHGADTEKIAEISRDFWDLRGRFDHISSVFNYFRELADNLRGRQGEVESKLDRVLQPRDFRMSSGARNSELTSLIDRVGH